MSGFTKPVKVIFSIRFRLLELTMGCVLFISIVQFSRINPLLQRSKIILPNLHFVVKHFLKLFLFSFFRCFADFSSAKIIISDQILLVNVFLPKHSL